MNNELVNTLSPDYHQNPDYLKYLQLVSVTLTAQDCAFICALLDSHWVHPDSAEYIEHLLTIPAQIKHCVAAGGFNDSFNYEEEQWKSNLRWKREKRLRALIEFVYKQDDCSLHELVALAPEVIENCAGELRRETDALVESLHTTK